MRGPSKRIALALVAILAALAALAGSASAATTTTKAQWYTGTKEGSVTTLTSKAPLDGLGVGST
jgi:ABC-type glycerol-3-phosphate transport system substrate-binding protein